MFKQYFHLMSAGPNCTPCTLHPPSKAYDHSLSVLSSYPSENYIFGKFDAFCKRLEKIADMADMMERLSDLQHIKIEGIEKIHIRYQTIVTSNKSKAYNVLDHRKPEVLISMS